MSSGRGAPTASVVVPTLLAGQGLEALADALGSQAPEHELIVVDNGGAVDAARLHALHPRVEVLSPGANLGFGRAVNAAARIAAGEALLTTNDDCVPEPGYVEALVAALGTLSSSGMAAGVLLQADDPRVIDSAGIEVDRTLMAFDRLNGSLAEALDGSDPFGPTGGAAAYRRDAFLEAGGFDERIHAYLEDVDLALRLRLAGWECAAAPTARALHVGSATLGSGSAAKNRAMGFGRGLLLAKWRVARGGRAAPVLSRELALCAGQALIDGNLAGVCGRVAGYRAGLAGERHPFPQAIIDRLAAPGPRLGARLRRRLGGPRRPDAARAGSLAILHLGEVSGPSRSLERELAWLERDGGLATLVPSVGERGANLGDVGELLVRDYSALTVPSGAAGWLRALAAQRREVRMFRREMAARRPGLVVVASATLPAALWAARRERVPALLYAGEILDATGRGPLRRFVAALLVGFTARSAAGVIACSERVAQQYESRGASEVSVVHPPVDERYERGDGAAFRSRFGIDPDAPLVVCVGALSRGRGQAVALHAVSWASRRFPRIRLALVGAPHPREVDREFAAELERAAVDLPGAAPLMTGFIDRPEDAYAAADLVVNPAYDEGFGRVAFEALRAGTPVVATAVGAVPDLLRDGSDALLVEPGDAEVLCAAITRVLEDPQLSASLAEAGSRRARSELDPARALETFQRTAGRVRRGC